MPTFRLNEDNEQLLERLHLNQDQGESLGKSEVEEEMDDTLVEQPAEDFADDDDGPAFVMDEPEYPQSPLHHDTLFDQSQLNEEAAQYVDELRSMINTKMELYGKNHTDLLGLWAGPEHWQRKFKRARKLVSIQECGLEKQKKGLAAKRVKLIAYAEMKEEEQENMTASGKVVKLVSNAIQLASGKKQISQKLNEKTLAKNLNTTFILAREQFEENCDILSLESPRISVLGFRIPSTKLKQLETEDRMYDDDVDDLPGNMSIPIDDDDEDDGAYHEFPLLTQGADLDLLTQPRLVSQIQVAYAKTAKTINVKLLKQHMWDRIKGLPEEPKAEGVSSVRLSGLMLSTAQSVDKKTAKQLSFPIMFNCLLHLANEKNFSLSGSETLLMRDMQLQRFLESDVKEEISYFAAKTTSHANTAKRQTRIDDWLADDEAVSFQS
ncbi:hypothetical protein Ciccas_008196 [Cichlidogyrus casuarinus]|uniref:Condensin complex subunit 2 n=1 Tax=Cichlidogyrus casuarinus TaxID=1844966 RepID=A0ABD2Q1G3_9PLAT